MKSRASRYESSRGARVESSDRAYFDQQVQEFERVQRASNRRREAGAALAEQETSLRAVEEELAQRGPEQTEWQHRLALLTRF